MLTTVKQVSRAEEVRDLELMTAQDLAELLGVSREWVYTQSRLGKIPTVTLGRYRRYRRSSIEAWIKQIEGVAR